MCSVRSLSSAPGWLLENGPKELDRLFRAIVYHPSAVLLLSGTNDPIPSGAKNSALYLLDIDGNIVAWYSSAARTYGYQDDEATGRHLSMLYPAEDALPVRLPQELDRANAEGHIATEGWHVRKDGSRFWANAITMALKDAGGDLQGFASVVRDFSDRHDRDEKLRRSRARNRRIPGKSTIAGVVSGEFDHIPDADDAFLEMVGYSRDDLQTGSLNWPALTPPEYAPLDELAHEEGLRFGASTPFEKELIRKDGTRFPVLVATAVLGLSPLPMDQLREGPSRARPPGEC